MRIDGATALVTGADGVLGRAFARALLDHGAARVYGTMPEPDVAPDGDVEALALEITDHRRVSRLAERLGDVTILVNATALAPAGPPLDVAAEDIRAAMEVNCLGPVVTTRAFAPVLAANGGGAVVTLLSVLSWVACPAVSAYAATASASWSMTNALRLQLRPQGTLVVGVHANLGHTTLGAVAAPADHRASDVAGATMLALAGDREEVLADELTRTVKASLHDDLGLLYPAVERASRRTADARPWAP